MGLRETAALDAQRIQEDAAGFRWPMTITAPDGGEAEVYGLSQDIHLSIDPETGQTVAGRQCTASVSLLSLAAAGMSIPKGEARQGKKPYLVEFKDISGALHVFKVAQAHPDQTLGNVIMGLEVYDG
jgi:hypothetical protein